MNTICNGKSFTDISLELYSTEWNYLQGLLWLQHIECLVNKRQIISVKSKKIIFGNLKDLISLHQEFIHSLYWLRIEFDLDAFIKLFKNLKFLDYIEYGSNLSKCQEECKTLFKSHSEFKRFMDVNHMIRNSFDILEYAKSFRIQSSLSRSLFIISHSKNL